jgi:hypothetical protein
VAVIVAVLIGLLIWWLVTRPAQPPNPQPLPPPAPSNVAGQFSTVNNGGQSQLVYLVYWQPPVWQGNMGALSYVYSVYLTSDANKTVVQSGTTASTSFQLLPNGQPPQLGTSYTVLVYSKNSAGQSLLPATGVVVPSVNAPFFNSSQFSDALVGQGSLQALYNVIYPPSQVTGASLSSALSGLVPASGGITGGGTGGGASGSTGISVQGVCAPTGPGTPIGNLVELQFQCNYDWSKSNPGLVPQYQSLLRSTSVATSSANTPSLPYQSQYTVGALTPGAPSAVLLHSPQPEVFFYTLPGGPVLLSQLLTTPLPWDSSTTYGQVIATRTQVIAAQQQGASWCTYAVILDDRTNTYGLAYPYNGTNTYSCGAAGYHQSNDQLGPDVTPVQYLNLYTVKPPPGMYAGVSPWNIDTNQWYAPQ